MKETIADLRGKTAIITGASNGLGRAAAFALAGMGAELVLICRDRELAATTVAAVRKATNNPHVDYLLADLSSQAQVRRVAAEFLASGRPLHILLNNAGALFPERCVSADGLEMTFALNHLGYFLLTQLLLERLHASAPARIVNVASRAHTAAKGMRFDDLQMERGYGVMAAYAQSKLANILFTRELATQLRGSRVTVNALHPGFVATRFGHANAFFRLAMGAMRPFQRSIDKGSRTPIYLCASPEVENVSGEYFADCRVVRPSRWALDAAAAQRLWQLSAQLVGEAAPAQPGSPDLAAGWSAG